MATSGLEKESDRRLRGEQRRLTQGEHLRRLDGLLVGLEKLDGIAAPGTTISAKIFTRVAAMAGDKGRSSCCLFGECQQNTMLYTYEVLCSSIQKQRFPPGVVREVRGTYVAERCVLGTIPLALPEVGTLASPVWYA